MLYIYFFVSVFNWLCMVCIEELCWVEKGDFNKQKWEFNYFKMLSIFSLSIFRSLLFLFIRRVVCAAICLALLCCESLVICIYYNPLVRYEQAVVCIFFPRRSLWRRFNNKLSPLCVFSFDLHDHVWIHSRGCC